MGRGSGWGWRGRKQLILPKKADDLKEGLRDNEALTSAQVTDIE